MTGNMSLTVVVFSLSLVLNAESQQQCPQIKAPPYADLIKTCGTNYQDTCYIKCPNEWDVLGTCYRTCGANGQWSGADLMCINRQFMCPPLVSPENGAIVTPCLNYAGGVCRFTCNEGSPMNGPENIFCSREQAWSDRAPTCGNANTTMGPPTGCGPVPQPLGSTLGGSCGGKLNDVCTITCAPPLNVLGTSPITCQPNGYWSAPFPACSQPQALTCPGVNPPLNGYGEQICSGAKSGQVCVFNCFNGYSIRGRTSITCLGNAWDGNPPTCEPTTCPPLTEIDNGQYTGTCNPGQLGQSCMLECGLGYRSSRDPTLVCMDSGWTNSYQFCEPIFCPPIGELANGYTAGQCNSGRGEQFCSFSCGRGYALVGNSTLFCQRDGSWSSQAPYCIQLVCPLLETNYGTFITPFDLCTQANVPVDTVCSFSCDTCSSIQGPNTATCFPSGEWSSNVPFCRKRTCGQITNLNNVYFNDALGQPCTYGTCGQKCRFSCNPGSNLIGIQTAVCGNNGRWDIDVLPYCEQLSCPALYDPQNGQGSPSCRSGTEGLCIFTCNNGYLLQSQISQFTCRSGQWNPSPAITPTCFQLNCPQVYPPLNGNASPNCATGQVGLQCALTCNDGYQSNFGTYVATCGSNSQWSSFPPPSPTCTPARCIVPSTPLGGSWLRQCGQETCLSKCTGTPGEICRLYCGEGITPAIDKFTCQLDNAGQGYIWVPSIVQANCGRTGSPRR